MNYRKLSLILPFNNSQRVSSDDDFDGDDIPDQKQTSEQSFESSQNHMSGSIIKEMQEHTENKRQADISENIASAGSRFTADPRYNSVDNANKRITVAELGVIANNYHEQQIAAEAEYIKLIEDLHEGLLAFLANIQFANQQFCAVDKDNPAIKEYTNFMAKELISAIREDFDLKCIRRLENYPYHDMRDIIKFLEHPYMRKEKIRIFADGVVERCIPVFSLMRDLVNDVVTDPDLRRSFGGGKYYHEDTMYSCNEQCFVSDVNCFFDTAVPYFES